MRLTTEQKTIIRDNLHNIVGDDLMDISVFGSRLKEEARGGDIDLVVRTARPVPLRLQARIKLRLETELSLPVDLVFVTKGKEPTAFQSLALASSAPLDEAAI